MLEGLKKKKSSMAALAASAVSQAIFFRSAWEAARAQIISAFISRPSPPESSGAYLPLTAWRVLRTSSIPCLDASLMQNGASSDKSHPSQNSQGSLITSMVMKEFGALPEVPIKRFPNIMLADAVRQTRIVVRRPAGVRCSPRFVLIMPPATSVRSRRTATSVQVISGCMLGSV